MKYEEIKERVMNKIGERLDELRKDAIENGYEIQVVKDNGIWNSERRAKETGNVIKIAVENAVIKEVIENGALTSETYNPPVKD